MTTQKRQGDKPVKSGKGFAEGSKATQFPPKHGMSTDGKGGRTPTYTVWRTMRQRCNYPGHKSYNSYGGRGIKVCARWDEFTNFLEDMGERPPGMTLGRIDNDGNYEPSNCRWETLIQQANNRRGNRLLCIDGVTHTLTEWSRMFGIPSDTLTHRFKRGWDVMVALTTPVLKRVDNRVVKG